MTQEKLVAKVADLQRQLDDVQKKEEDFASKVADLRVQIRFAWAELREFQDRLVAEAIAGGQQ